MYCIILSPVNLRLIFNIIPSVMIFYNEWNSFTFVDSIYQSYMHAKRDGLFQVIKWDTYLMFAK